MNACIEIQNLCVEFPAAGKPPIRAVDNLNLQVETGTVFGFLGPNGAGKTTTMHVLLGFIAPSSGEARVLGKDVRKSVARQKIGYLSEHSDTYRFLTGHELLRLTGEIFKIPRAELRRRVEETLALVGLEDSAASRRIGTYSKGMLQRICLAQSVINDPDLVILDEPTGGLDPIGRLAIRKIIKQLSARGKTVFFSSHELSEVELVCDQLAILSRGRVVAEGKAQELVKPGQSLEQYFMSVVNADTPP